MIPAKEIGFGFRSRGLAYLALLFLASFYRAGSRDCFEVVATPGGLFEVAFRESTFKWKYPDRTPMPIDEMRGILIAFSRFERTKKNPRRYFEKKTPRGFFY